MLLLPSSTPFCVKKPEMRRRQRNPANELVQGRGGGGEEICGKAYRIHCYSDEYAACYCFSIGGVIFDGTSHRMMVFLRRPVSTRVSSLICMWSCKTARGYRIGWIQDRMVLTAKRAPIVLRMTTANTDITMLL
jgi:hypothetical protein